jgi:WS/DGAT/MGAT family acyltransferase
LAQEWPAVREVLAEPALPPTSLDRRVGRDRSIALVRSDLELVQNVAHAHDAKVNDVFLTLIAGGLRTLLRSRGEAVEGRIMRIYVPISLRHGARATTRGNLVAQMVVPLPVGISDAVERLHRISAETVNRKARARPSLGVLPTRGVFGKTMLKLVERQRVNVESADLRGPTSPLYLAGARVVELFPLLPLIGRVSLGVGAISYAGQLDIGVVADSEAHPDLDVFAAGVLDELHALESRVHSLAAA